EPHPEGGYYKQTYKSTQMIEAGSLHGYEGARSCVTSIYFLITASNFSAFHRIKQDEVWNFYQGCAITLHVITAEGEYQNIKIGHNLDAGEIPQYVVKGGDWFASEVDSENRDDFALVGCTVAPGFEFKDFELAKRKDLTKKYPSFAKIIEKLTRE
ncbi:MAG: cupin domain-containing protein, partial [Flavobacteriales bacterium]|nr:cupin domain-containing protein [Flavobacteriales bacterium]